eukprot:s1798_g11.t1
MFSRVQTKLCLACGQESASLQFQSTWSGHFRRCECPRTPQLRRLKMTENVLRLDQRWRLLFNFRPVELAAAESDAATV